MNYLDNPNEITRESLLSILEIMHGGVMALFGIMAQSLTERSMKINPLLYVPGFIVAITIHSAFNHFPGTPIRTTLGTLIVLPPILFVAFQKSAKSMHNWLELDFDDDALLLEQINSGRLLNRKQVSFWKT